MIQKDDPYVKKYQNKYIDKINFLQKVITEQETGENVFKVINLEAGLGKSYYTDLIIKDYLHNNWQDKRKFLVVKRFNDESITSAKRIESGFLGNQAVAITSETWKKWRKMIDELIKIPVIIISHKRYIDLCLKDNERSIFTKERHTLIIDEKINFPIYTYSDRFQSEIRGMISIVNRELFDEICLQLQEIIEKYKDSTACIKVNPEISKKKLKQFKNMMHVEISQKVSQHEKRLMCDFLDTILLCYDSKVIKIYNGQKISTLNRNHKHWGLRNNIILDASAKIDGIYLTDTEKYDFRKQTPFIDHSKSEFIHIDLKSSKHYIKQNENKYLDQMIELINERQIEGEKTLIVIHKQFAETLYLKMIHKYGDKVWKDKQKEYDSEYNNQPFAITWFGNLVGKNDFADFNNIWVLGTPNIPLSNYLVHYMQYADKSLGKNGLKIYEGKFINEKFKRVQEGYVAAEIYQTLKRIQRNPEPKGKFYIVTKDKEMIDTVLSQLKNAKLTETITLQEKEISKKPTKNELIAQYIIHKVEETNKKQTLLKKDLSKMFGTIRWERVKQHPDIKKLNKQGKLKEQRKYFVIYP